MDDFRNIDFTNYLIVFDGNILGISVAPGELMADGDLKKYADCRTPEYAAWINLKQAKMICRKNSDQRAGSRTPTRNSGGRNPPLPSHGTLPVRPHQDASIREIRGHLRYAKEHGCRVFLTTISSTARIA